MTERSGPVLLVSDLHLDAQRPAATARFLDLLADEARSANSLYILGDLFETWVGDDDDAALALSVQAALAQLTASGVPTFFVAGNRDFLIGPAFAARTGVQILEDPWVVWLHGRRVLLSHGDALCTRDVRYQALRRQLRDPAWQREFLIRPLAERRQFASHARRESQSYISQQTDEIMDVTPELVELWLETHGVSTLIHGHTHRPMVHDLGNGRRRIVLGDWYERDSVGVWTADHEFELRSRPLS